MPISKTDLVVEMLASLYQTYFNNCDEKSTVPSFGRFIIHHSIQPADEFQKKGDALKKWKELVCEKDIKKYQAKQTPDRNCRRLLFSRFKKPSGPGASQARDAEKHSSRLGKTLEIKEVLGNKTCTKIKQELFGKLNRMPTSIKQELEDALLDFGDAEDEVAEESEDRLFSLKKKANGAAERQAADEMLLQSNIVPALCLKHLDITAPEDQMLTVSIDATKSSSLVLLKLANAGQTLLRVLRAHRPFIHAIGEINGDDANNEGIGLDTYRFGGLLMLREHRFKKAQWFFKSQVMFDIAMLYEQHCNVDYSSAAPEWKLVSYNAIKEL
ncbi:hypothetical protein EDC96DRAFT_543995 [Choanephora cucurbitarum]|nr:hypothetical protein EDC96DRAFT_543995 [Choanephora cucurbitarum]